MDQATFDEFRQFTYNQCGIAIKGSKKAMVQARVSRRMNALGYDDPRGYLNYLTSDRSGNEIVLFLDCITTNLTSFFREPHHFDFVKEVFSGWLDEGKTRFRFWSAACSTGEEPYSLAMTLLETMNGRAVDARILATDLSTEALNKAQEGMYDNDRVASIPAPVRSRYLNPHHKNGKRLARVDGRLRELVLFKRLNLSNIPLPLKGPLDMVFCRNVMIYFDNGFRKKLLREIHHLLKPGGYLLVGHAESLAGMMGDLRYVAPSIYRKP